MIVDLMSLFLECDISVYMLREENRGGWREGRGGRAGDRKKWGIVPREIEKIVCSSVCNANR
jgi:hypothetical protein